MANPFKHLDGTAVLGGYDLQFWFKYFSVQIVQSGEVKFARFKKHRITGATYVFQANCRESENCWNEPGYGWGYWEKV